MIRVFLSYRRSDSRHQTGRLYDRLVGRFGADNVFIDVAAMPMGSDFRIVLTERVAGCDVLLAVIGDDWLSAGDGGGPRRLEDPGDFVRIEVESALRRGVQVIPVLVGSAGMPGPDDLPGSLRELAFRHAARVRTDDDFHPDVDRLIAGIERAVNRGWTGPQEPLERFGRFRVVSRLGEGSSGSAYLADDAIFGRRVVLRLPGLGPEDSLEARERYLRLSRAAMGLRHPQLCRIYEAGEVDGRPFLTMEHVQGKSLARTIPSGGLPPRQVAALVGKLGLALREAHAVGVVLANLRPENVIFPTAGPRREPIIVGFGPASWGGRPGVPPGVTGPSNRERAYIAPEALQGGSGSLAPAIDVFALGVMLHELLTGLPPLAFGAGPAGRPGPEALDTIRTRAMAEHPGDRFPDIATLADALAAYVRSPTV